MSPERILHESEHDAGSFVMPITNASGVVNKELDLPTSSLELQKPVEAEPDQVIEDFISAVDTYNSFTQINQLWHEQERMNDCIQTIKSKVVALSELPDLTLTAKLASNKEFRAKLQQASGITERIIRTTSIAIPQANKLLASQLLGYANDPSLHELYNSLQSKDEFSKDLKTKVTQDLLESYRANPAQTIQLLKNPYLLLRLVNDLSDEQFSIIITSVGHATQRTPGAGLSDILTEANRDSDDITKGRLGQLQDAVLGFSLEANEAVGYWQNSSLINRLTDNSWQQLNELISRPDFAEHNSKKQLVNTLLEINRNAFLSPVYQEHNIRSTRSGQLLEMMYSLGTWHEYINAWERGGGRDKLEKEKSLNDTLLQFDDTIRISPADADEAMLMHKTIAELEEPHLSEIEIQNSISAYVMENLRWVIQNEEIHPGITNVLTHEYGIYNFTRYPREMLTSQFEKRTDTQTPYGLLVYPRDDWNQAFNNPSSLDNFAKEISGKYLARIYETENAAGLVKAILKSNRIYGHNQKIGFLVLAGHGQENGINFGGQSPITSPFQQKLEPLRIKHVFPSKRVITESPTVSHGDLTSKDLRTVAESGTLDRIASMFTDHPPVVLISCSTGAPEGFAQTLSELVPLKVIAPTIPVALKSIKPLLVEGKIVDIDAEYHSEKNIIGRYSS